MIIIDSLKNLVDRNKIKVYAYVIMNNHVHLIWELLENNGKEQAHASFMKFTSHEFKKVLIANYPQVLEFFKVESITRKYQFWIRDSLPIILYTPEVINQKIDYIHNNPVVCTPSSVNLATDYRFSSANFYENGIDGFGFLTHIEAWYN
jgi:putative transposase